MSLFNCSKCWRRRGLTLLEVVAGLTLLATLLVATLLGFGVHTHQIRAAQRRLQAVELLDGLLVRWHERSGVPERAEGLLSDERGLRIDEWSVAWRWQTVPLPAEEHLTRFQSRKVRVEIRDPAIGLDSAPLAFVELLVPPRPPQPGDDGRANDAR